MNDVDITRNIMYLTGDIVEDTVPYFISRVNYLVEHNKDREILVYINSYGGDMYSAFGIIDYMRVCDVKIGMACYGAAMSGAALILLNATGEIVMSTNSYLMFHPPWFDKDEKERIDTKHMSDLKEKILKHLVTHSNKDQDFWEEISKQDTFLTSDECLEYGIVDEIT